MSLPVFSDLRSDQVKELPRGDDSDTFKTLGEVSGVAGDDVVGAGGDGTFQETVISLVRRCGQAAGGFDQAADVADDGQGTGHGSRGETEVGAAQHGFVFCRMAGETNIRMVLLAARSKTAAGRPSSLKLADTTTLVSITTFICWGA